MNLNDLKILSNHLISFAGTVCFCTVYCIFQDIDWPWRDVS